MRLPDKPAKGSELSASWGAQLIDYVRSITIKQSPDMLVNTTSNGTTIKPTALGIGAGETASEEFPFEIYRTDVLKIKIRAGTVLWHSYNIEVAESAEQTLSASATKYFWLILSSAFPASPPPTITLGSGAAWPTETITPARLFWRLGTVVTDATDITDISQYWSDNVPWPPVLTFWA